MQCHLVKMGNISAILDLRGKSGGDFPGRSSPDATDSIYAGIRAIA
jgi:hypothetical protein